VGFRGEHFNRNYHRSSPGPCVGCARTPTAIPYAVGLYITAAYWFTASTSFANPAVTIARSLSDTFAGIAPAGIIAFICAQFAGMVAAVLLAHWLWPNPGSFSPRKVRPLCRRLHNSEGKGATKCRPCFRDGFQWTRRQLAEIISKCMHGHIFSMCVCRGSAMSKMDIAPCADVCKNLFHETPSAKAVGR
jgi:glycerol uptake facilitator-like aquaporin